MAKKDKTKPVDGFNDNPETDVKPNETKPVDGFVEIEITVAVAGMEIGTVKKVPLSLANQMVDLKQAKIKN